MCHFLGHSHLDAAWLWSFNESKEVFHDTCEIILKLMEKYQDLCFCQSSAQYYKWLEEFPETFEKVRRKVKEGCWEIVGGTWVEPDGNLPSGESLVRQFLFGKSYFREKFNVDVEVAWFPDSFGYAGMRSIRWASSRRNPFRHFFCFIFGSSFRSMHIFNSHTVN